MHGLPLLLWLQALALLAQMDEEGIKPNTIVYSAAISACGASGEWESALALFERMEQLRVPRNTISYNAAIQACTRGGAWQHALTLFDRMGAAGVKRDSTTYNTAVKACEKAGEYKLAFELRMEGAKMLSDATGGDGSAVAGSGGPREGVRDHEGGGAGENALREMEVREEEEARRRQD